MVTAKTDVQWKWTEDNFFFYFKICTVHIYYLYNESTYAKLINNLLYCSLLHCPYMLRRYYVIFRKLVVNTC